MPLWMIDGASRGHLTLSLKCHPALEALLSRNQSPENAVPISEPYTEHQEAQAEGEPSVGPVCFSQLLLLSHVYNKQSA